MNATNIFSFIIFIFILMMHTHTHTEINIKKKISFILFLACLLFIILLVDQYIIHNNEK